MKISLLKISNFLKIKDIEMNPSHTNVITGRNRQGKTSILKAIRAVFTGEVDETSIRDGEAQAEIILELDELNIKRTITPRGNKLSISNKEGMKMPAPQSFLDGLIGDFSFNPIAFFDLKQADRKKYLLNAIKLTITQDELAEYTGEKLAGLDYEGSHALEVVEQARKWYYDQRTVANAEVTKKRKALDDTLATLPPNFKPGEVTEKMIDDVREAIRVDELEHMKFDANEKELTRLRGEEAELQAKLKVVQEQIVAAATAQFDICDPMTIDAAKETLKNLESKREFAFAAKRAEELRSELSEAVKEAEAKDAIVKKLSKEVPEDLISKAELPIAGLSIDGDDIKINGVSLDNLSTSEQLKLGLDVVRALNKNFKIICVDGMEALDPESFANFLKEIENDDYNYFITRVDMDSPHSIVVEDGEIKK